MQYVPKWKENGWRKADETPVKNKVKQIFEEKYRLFISLKPKGLFQYFSVCILTIASIS
jgi:hypothetical protein